MWGVEVVSVYSYCPYALPQYVVRPTSQQISFDTVDTSRRSSKTPHPAPKTPGDDSDTVDEPNAQTEMVTHKGTAIDLPKRLDRMSIVGSSYGTVDHGDLECNGERMFRGPHSHDKRIASHRHEEDVARQRKKRLPQAKSFESGKNLLEPDTRKLITIRVSELLA